MEAKAISDNQTRLIEALGNLPPRPRASIRRRETDKSNGTQPDPILIQDALDAFRVICIDPSQENGGLIFQAFRQLNHHAPKELLDTYIIILNDSVETPSLDGPFSDLVDLIVCDLMIKRLEGVRDFLRDTSKPLRNRVVLAYKIYRYIESRSREIIKYIGEDNTSLLKTICEDVIREYGSSEEGERLAKEETTRKIMSIRRELLEWRDESEDKRLAANLIDPELLGLLGCDDPASLPKQEADRLIEIYERLNSLVKKMIGI